jgi:hypothetical protein
MKQVTIGQENNAPSIGLLGNSDPTIVILQNGARAMNGDPLFSPQQKEDKVVAINKEVMEIVNGAGRIGTLGTANRQGEPNVAYFGSPRLSEDGTITMGLASNRTLKNLEENPRAVFFCVAESPVTFTTPGYRLYLKVREIQKSGPILDGVKKAIAEHAGPQAAAMMAAGVVFDVTEIRPLVAME